MDTSKQLLRVAQITQIDPFVRLYRLKPARQGTCLASFSPGQYLSLFYTIGGSTASRPYSIASSPKEAAGPQGYYELLIHGGGSFTSAWLFKNVEEGDTVEASQPLGDFYLPPEVQGKDLVGISGGMSVTPLLSMARAVADGSLNANMTLFCGWDNAGDVLYRQELLGYQQKCPRLKVVFCVLNDPLPGDEAGYPTLALVQKHCQPQKSRFFVCGPPEMYHFLETELAPLGILPQEYQRELPGEANCENCGQGLPQENYTLCVEIDSKIHKVSVNSKETLLVAMERAGLAPQARCRSGHCNYCLSQLVAGHVWVPKSREERTQEERQQGLIHPCCSFPLSDLELKLSI